MTEPVSADDPYYVALGLFIDVFATVETLMQVLLWNVTSVKPDVARAMFDTGGVEAAKQKVRKLFEAKGFTEPPLFKAAIDQLTVIAKARNLIVHYASNVDEENGGRIVTNGIHAYTPKQRKRLHVTPELLRGMVQDLNLINGRITHFEMKYIGGAPMPDSEWEPLIRPNQQWAFNWPRQDRK